MKTRITLILLTAFALCSCSGGLPNSIGEDISEQSNQEPALVLMDMAFTGKMTLDNKGYNLLPVTKSDIENRWFNENSYNSAKRLLKTYNKDFKDLMSKLKKKFGTDKFILHDATIQSEFTGPQYSDYNSGNNRRLVTRDTNPADTSYIVKDGIRLITAICYEHEPGAPDYFNDDNNDRLHFLAAEIAEEIHVYCRQGIGSIFIQLPDSNIPISLTYLTSFPYGGFCEW